MTTTRTRLTSSGLTRLALSVLLLLLVASACEAPPKVVPSGDVPDADKLARQTATVALSGDGGDELFAGYHHHFLGRRLHRRVSAVPRFARGTVGRVLQLVPRTRNLGRGLVEDDPLARYRETMKIRELPKLDDPTEMAMFLDFVTYLPDDILVKVDRASMAVSLEAREPFLDHRVVEFAWSLPLSMKIRDDRGKWITRALLRRYLPDALVDREKQGFGVPLAQWLRGPLREWAEDLLPPHARALWQQHIAGANHEGMLWRVLMYEAWRRQ
jgi:asparagine synthase (glutamine-hydrolysing)